MDGREFVQFFFGFEQGVLVVRRFFQRGGAVVVFVVIACADEGFAVFVVAALQQGFFFFVGVGVAVAVHQVAQAAFAGVDFGEFFQQRGDGKREFGQCLLYGVESCLDALGYGDFAFAGEEIDCAHFAHVHAYRIGGTANFGFVQGGRARYFFFVIGGDDAAVFLRAFDDVNAHFNDERDHFVVFVAFQGVFRQRFVDFFVGQESLFTPRRGAL